MSSQRAFRRCRSAAFAAVWLAIAGLCWAPSASQAQASRSGGTQAEQDDKDLVAWVHTHLASLLTVPSDLVIDADLRTAANAMVAKELPRMKQLVIAWLAEQPADRTPGEKALALRSRLYNEVGLWMLDRDGPEHDRRLQRAYAKPRSCDFIGPKSTVYGMAVQAWQQVPPEQRTALLASEARLLARWGVPRPMAPQRPAEAVSDRVLKVFASHVEQGTPLPYPLPPVTAWQLFSESERDRDRPMMERRCLARQWALQATLARGSGGPDEAGWIAHLYDRIPDARYSFSLHQDDGKPDEYPAVAAKLRVEGEVVVEFTAGPDGKPRGARIVERDIKAFGIAGQRPVVFDTLLDDASLQRLSLMSFAGTPAGKSTGGGELRMPFGYVLE